MKKIFLFLLTTIISISSFAQNLPQGIAYQAVAVKEGPYSVAGENPQAIYWSNKDIKVRFTILDQYPNPTDTYQEFHSVTTDDYGVFNLIIGQGSVLSGDFETIPWELGTAHLQVEIDFDNDNNYVVTSFERFWSVPYAKYSQASEETDPIFNTSVAKGITSTDTAYWNNKLDSYTETDPIFNASVAKGITSTDTAYWNNKLDSYTETDPIFNASVAKGIKSTDTAYWNNKLDSYTETDPIFDSSVAKGITSTDTAYWNSNQDLDSTNELQQISISNDTLFLSNGGFVKLPNSLGQNTSTRLSVKNNYDGAVVTKTGNAGGRLNPTTVTSGSRFINDTVPAGKVYHITYLKLTKSGTRHKSYFRINGQVVCDGDNGSIHENGPTDLWLGPGDILSYSPGLFDGYNGGWSNEWIISYFIMDTLIKEKIVTKTGNAGGRLNPTTVTSGSRFINDTVPAGKVYHITYLKLTKSGTRHKSYFRINGQVVCDGDNGSIHENGPTDLWLGPGDILSYSPGLFDGYNGGWSNEWIISYFELPD